jgi:hypothetical protein
MRWIVIAFAMLAACGDDRCLPCKGAISAGIRYDCDAGTCVTATPVYECTCRSGQNLAIWTFPATDTCEAARVSWSSFSDSACP